MTRDQPLTRPQAILFDWDNTLIDSWHAILDAQNHTLEAFGLQPWTLEEARERVRCSMRDTFPALFGARWREAGEVFYRRFTERHMQNLRPLPGAEDLPALSTGARQNSYSALRDPSDQLGHNGRDRVDRLRHDD